MNIIWSPTARRRAQAAVDFIAADRPLGAVEWLEGLIDRLELLRDFPEQGRIVPEWNEPTVREIVYASLRTA